jgi:hypothetical protein
MVAKTAQSSLPKVRVTFQKKEYQGYILETKYGENLVEYYNGDGSYAGRRIFENNEIKRFWS